MKFLLTLLLFIHLSSVPIASNAKAEAKCFQEKPTIKSIVESTIDKNGLIESKINFSFDLDGNLIKRVSLKGGEEIEVNLYQYDGGKLMEKCIGIYEHFDPFDSEYRCAGLESYRYNDFGQIRKSISFDSSSATNPITKLYYYNDDLSLSKVSYLEEDESLGSIDTFFYDREGRLTRMERKDEQGIILKIVKYKYNWEGYLKKTTELDERNKLFVQYLYRYNQGGEKIRQNTIRYTKEKKQSIKSKYYYNQFGDTVKEEIFSRGRLIEIKNRDITYYE